MTQLFAGGGVQLRTVAPALTTTKLSSSTHMSVILLDDITVRGYVFEEAEQQCFGSV